MQEATLGTSRKKNQLSIHATAIYLPALITNCTRLCFLLNLCHAPAVSDVSERSLAFRLLKPEKFARFGYFGVNYLYAVNEKCKQPCFTNSRTVLACSYWNEFAPNYFFNNYNYLRYELVIHFLRWLCYILWKNNFCYTENLWGRGMFLYFNSLEDANYFNY